MKWLILLLIFGTGIVFFISNGQPVTLIFFGGTLTATMPIAVWVLLFIASGILTSLLFQLLNLRPQSAPTQEDYAPQPPQPPPYSPPPPKKPPVSRPKPPLEKPSPSIDSRRVDADWDKRNPNEEEEEWEIEELPSQPTPIRERVRERLQVEQSPPVEARQQPQAASQEGSIYSYTYREPKNHPRDSQPPSPEVTKIQEELPEPLPEKEYPSFETQQQPKSVSREGSIYSYTYREPRDRESPPPAKRPPANRQKALPETPKSRNNPIYDAEYRVITPPYRENPELGFDDYDDAEDWI